MPVPFAVIPTDLGDRSLTMLIDKRDCGALPGEPRAETHLVETDEAVTVRVDVRTGVDGETCSNNQLSELEIELTSRLGGRRIIDASDGQPALVNGFDLIDTGFEYACGFRADERFTIAELMGPGQDISALDIPSSLDGLRAMTNQGDRVVLRGPFDERGSFRTETWRLRGEDWKRKRGRCRPTAFTLRGSIPRRGDSVGPAPVPARANSRSGSGSGPAPAVSRPSDASRRPSSRSTRAPS